MAKSVQIPEEQKNLTYVAEPTARAFHYSHDFVRGLRGPVGSGKTTACIMELYTRALEQKPFNGVRRSRWALIRNCYDDQTEILTERRGFQLFRDLEATDSVATLQDDKLVYARPDGVAVHPYEGKMIGFASESVDFLVTPDHKMYVSRARTRKKVFDEYHVETAQEVYDRGRGYPAYRVKKNAIPWEGSGLVCTAHTDLFEFLGYWFAKGTAKVYPEHGPRWTLTSQNDVEYVRELLPRAGIKFTEASRGPGKGVTFNLDYKGNPDLFASLCTCGGATTKKVPGWIMEADGKSLSAFLRGFTVGDGSVRKEGTVTLYTSSEHLANALQEMALKTGGAANLSSRDRRGMPVVFDGEIKGKVNAVEYTVTLLGPSKMEPYLYQQPGKKNTRRGWYEQEYNGFVYCVELPLVPVYVRRNGKCFWCMRTYPELLSTTLKTFEEWIPREICPVVQSSPIRGILRVDLKDGTRVEAEFLFLALDQEDDVKKLKSLELTGAFINEASEIRRSVLDMLTSRVDRYPAKMSGGCTWTGIIMDTNPPSDAHWWYKLAEIEKPQGYTFWAQPPAMLKGFDKDKNPVYMPNDGSQRGIPAAENISNHNSGFGYYERMIPGKDAEWIKVYVLGEYGSVFDGKPVYPEFSDTVHTAKEPLEPYRGVPLVLCWDFGLTPTCVIMQMTPRGQLRILDELISDNMGIERFARDVVKPALAVEKYQGMAFSSVADPAGSQRAQTNEVTCLQMLDMQGFRTESAPTNAFLPRREAVAWFLTKMTDGEPGFQLSPTCEVLRKGFMGGYQYRRMKVPGGGERHAESPDKNEYSHSQDCVQYGCSFLRSASRDIGLGGYNSAMGGQRRSVKRKDFGAWS